MPNRNRICIAAIFSLTWLLVGCAAEPKNPDPWEKTNRYFYRANERFDAKFFKPAADLYVKIFPPTVRKALGNAFANLAYPDVILNDFLQLKLGQGLADSARMALNSTLGIAGLEDIATRHGLPAHENDFGVTLGKWGFGPGPYMMLPFFGPSTVRDAWDIPVSFVTDPLFWVSMPFAASAGLNTTQALQMRSQYEGALRFRNQAALDPYVFTREGYLAYRRHLIHPQSAASTSDIYDEPAEPSTAPATRPTTP